jgi:1,4-dihydroxy-2-naphthoate octaprenyltransferase
MGALGLFQSTRPAFFSISFMSILVAHALTFKHHSTFHPLLFLESSLALVFAHAAGNLSNSYFDFMYGLDKPKTAADRSLFDFGVSPKEALGLMLVCYALGGMIALDLLVKSGMRLLPLILLGAFLSFFYTAGPIKLKYHALGDVTIFLCFGPLTVLWGYFVQMHQWSWEAFVYGIPVGLLAVAVLLANNTRDIEHDKKAGATTTAQFLGRNGAYFYYVGLFVACNVLMIALAVLQRNVFLCLPLLATFFKAPTLWNSFKNAKWDNICENTAQFGLLFAAAECIGILLG